MASTSSSRGHRRSSIFLIGAAKHEITGSKLPSKGDVLKLFFYNLRYRKLEIAGSATLVTDEVVLFWKKARIPTQAHDKIRKKVIRLYEEWRALQKHKTRNSALDRTRENDFVDSLPNLFDVALNNALTKMKIEEDKLFLLEQRKPGRPGCMIGVDRKLAGIEARRECREKKEEERKKRELKSADTVNQVSFRNVIPIRTFT